MRYRDLVQEMNSRAWTILKNRKVFCSPLPGIERPYRASRRRANDPCILKTSRRKEVAVIVFRDGFEA